MTAQTPLPSEEQNELPLQVSEKASGSSAATWIFFIALFITISPLILLIIALVDNSSNGLMHLNYAFILACVTTPIAFILALVGLFLWFRKNKMGQSANNKSIFVGFVVLLIILSYALTAENGVILTGFVAVLDILFNVIKAGLGFGLE